ncbi:CHASE2 domain-containing protein [Ancylothrix sp. C2]|uniref:CHASE2 domain-containing protein n=1 Tax=Ancylothrix sp. D3o TaxID=2953691 RepID=UPI0021BB2860|nr:CHASE2 domain-containing protein [Ancylothrix sp. D3o]MCT7950344.1 CHASE2 domain-containing protein [Ancylothrix sp. D3o]
MWQKVKKQFAKRLAKLKRSSNLSYRKGWGVLIIGPAVGVGVIGATYLGVFQLLEWAVLDRFFLMRPLEAPDERIVIVTIDESDIQYVKQWPATDEVLAELLEKIRKMEPRAIGLDIFRDLAVPPGHEKLQEIFRTTPNLIGVEKVVGKPVEPPPVLAEFERVSMADLVLDADGKVRRALLSVRVDKGKTKLSLGTQLGLMYLEKEGIALRMINPAKQHLGLGKAVFVPFARNDGAYVGGDAGGYQILLNYRGPRENFYTVSLKDVLEDKVSPAQLKDRLVLIGATGISLNDVFFTPYSNSVAKAPIRTPGVVIHANIASQIISAAMDGRPLIKVWDEKFEWLWLMLWSFVGAGGGWLICEAKNLNKNFFIKWAVRGAFLAGLSASLMGGSYVFFLATWWVPVVSPLLAFAGSAVLVFAYHTQELQRSQEAQLAQFLEAMPVGVAVLDAAGHPYFMNKLGKKLLGQGVKADATKSRIAEVYGCYVAGTNELYPNERQPILRALKGEVSSVDDLEIHIGDQVIPLEAWGTPIYDADGKVAYALSAFQDITERKKAQRDLAEMLDELFKANCNLQKALDAEFNITDAYGRFVPHEFLYFLGYESILDVKLGDNVQLDMAILFADIRDFTTLSETMNPEDNFKFINAYLSRMEPAIAENNGFIDKYIGDAIMALFSGGADDAIKAGISMLQKLAEYNATRGTPKRPCIQIGIGINTGSLMLGTVGGESRMNSTVISDAVNLASRMEGLTKNYGVSLLISHHTFSRLEDSTQYCIRLIDSVKVKGKSEKVSVFEVFDADPPDIKQRKLATKPLFEEAILLYYMQSFREAGQKFQECCQLNPQDRVSQIYLERCQNCLKDNYPTNNSFPSSEW